MPVTFERPDDNRAASGRMFEKVKRERRQVHFPTPALHDPEPSPANIVSGHSSCAIHICACKSGSQRIAFSTDRDVEQNNVYSNGYQL